MDFQKSPLNKSKNKIVHTLNALIKGLASKKIIKRNRFTLEQPVTVRDHTATFLRQTLAIALALFIITSIAPTHILETGYTADYFADTDFIEEGDELQLELPPFLMNEEGFVLKTTPGSEDVSRIGLTDTVKHTIVGGDTLSGIGALYGVSVKTIMWENNINENTPLKLGMVLTVPPVDGVNHVATKKDTLSTIAKQYGVEEKLIAEHNNLTSDVIADGQKLFIPGGARKVEVAPVIARAGTRSGSRGAGNTFTPKIVISTSATPAAGKSFIFPTNGKITQGFHAGHYALDIGNPAMPDIWSSASGRVVKVFTGCPERDVRVERGCGGGYGNHVIVDHGDKTQTLYGHMSSVYVSNGQEVGSGQALGRMGNSGRTYGVTGIHLHVELYMNGQKKNLANFL